MKFKKIILPIRLRKKINKELTDFTYNTYFSQIPLKDIENILKKYNIILLQEDYTKWSGILLGNHSSTTFEIADNTTIDGNFYKPYKNCLLVLSWYKLESGRYEILIYIS